MRSFVPAALVTAALLLGSAPAQSAAGERRPVTAEDLFRLRLISQTAISPDGERVAFVVSRMNGPKNRYDTDLWIADASGGGSRALTSDGRSDGPAWSPDGTRIVFTRNLANVPQLYAYDVRAQRVRQLTSVPSGASGAVWSHDGKHIAFGSDFVDAAPPARIDFAAAGFTPQPGQRTSDIRTIDTERYEVNGLGYTYDKHRHLFVANADGSGARRLTPDEPWSENEYAWSPDDATLAFTSLRRETPAIGESDVYTIPFTGGRPALVPSPRAGNAQPAFDADGNLLFFSRSVRDSASYPALVLEHPDGTGRREIVAENRTMFGDWILADLKMPGTTCGPLPSPAGRFAIVNANGPGYSALSRIDLASGALRELTPPGEASDCTLDRAGDRIAYTYSDFVHPAEAYVLDVATGASHPVGALNAPYLASVELSVPQPFVVKDRAGFDVHAWFMPAVGPSAHGPRPTLLHIHGGPQAQFGNTFFHEFQYEAGLGYNVVFSDPRGSIGFGYPFEEALVGRWGPPMFEDVEAVMDAALRRPDVDRSQLGVIGGSYGGYATLWIVSHTGRYKAAVAERPASELATQQLDSFFASSNGLGGEYAWGKPWIAGGANAADSPLTYVENVHTPLMLLHSSEDTETPLDQTLDEFSALKQLGREVRFVDVPHENHDLNRTGAPIHRVERLHIIADWFASHLRR